MRATFVVSLLILVTFGCATAQEVLMQPGQRVRVTVPSLDLNKHKATFQRLHGDTLVLSSASYLLSDVTRLDRYAGRHAHPWRGAAIGFCGGAVIGGAVVAAGVTDYEPGDELYEVFVLVGAGIGAAVGLVIGAATGAMVKTDSWSEVPLDRLRVTVVPQGHGMIGLAVSVSF